MNWITSMYMNERETTPVIGTTKWPIHVAHIINKLYYAGKEVGIVKLLNGLNENYFHGLLIVMDPITEIVGLNTEKVELISLNKNPGNDLRIPFKLARIFKDKKVDIVHTHAWGTLVEGMIGAKMARVPVVIHGEHGTFHKTGKRRLVQNFLWKKADRLLSVSDVLARNLEQHIGLRKNSFETILNGVDTQRFRPDPVARLAVRKEWAIPKNRVVIGSVGRLAPVKNYPLLIEAAHLVIKKGYTPTFVIVGNNTDAMVKKDLIHQVASLGLKEHVRFVDKRGDIQRVMNAFDVFALTSFSEGCSNVIQEAMATGLPVVASRVGGNPELIRDGETGMLFTSNNKYELFDRL
ncbi:MAG: glycosyltransferase [Calditrichaeota bacterium]|nr:MAG: glycosyltransferase [Calditrichota bacterium]